MQTKPFGAIEPRQRRQTPTVICDADL